MNATYSHIVEVGARWFRAIDPETETNIDYDCEVADATGVITMMINAAGANGAAALVLGGDDVIDKDGQLRSLSAIISAAVGFDVNTVHISHPVTKHPAPVYEVVDDLYFYWRWGRRQIARWLESEHL